MVEVSTKYGTMVGADGPDGTQSFKGIPFAKPPVGPLRWKAPQPLEPNGGVHDCTDYGYSAMQKYDPVMYASRRQQNEDCLTLNIWRPDGESKDLPVMVFIHGGAYVEGGSSDPMYDGTNIVRRDKVIYVTFNYRVNLFGFMNLASLPGGAEYKESGYAGLMDQAAALGWVKENIADFGGDPENITLFGESCGSGSTMLLSVAPSAKGLFHRAIGESGPIQLYNRPEATAPYAQEFMEMLGCKSAQEMAALPVGDIMMKFTEEFFPKHIHEVSLIFAPTCDGDFLPKKPLKAFKDGAAKDIDIMIGCNEDEFAYWKLYFKDFATEMPDFWHHQAIFHFDGKLDSDKYESEWKSRHTEGDQAESYLEYANQIGFRVGTDLMAEYQSQYRDTYEYLFTYASKIPGMGSCHAIELPFVMHNTQRPDLPKTLTGEVPPMHLSDEMADAWASFAATGKPVSGVGDSWEPYGAGEPHHTMVINEDGWKLEQDVNKENIDMLRPAFQECLLESE
ncbi:carboxylesterase/lipase family protein [Bifidobacterium xylocopae]|uniref:Carboxylesterase type B domain-containing protein n=1 Tax=Bifidobacterium xylocopae TaxID=2493119 RepID=A0A366KCX8_9BIFI|nr:carboxylesterase family protein [Bifidobacterium xylocopae]RBP98973.1 hypothetical protein CRD59_06180 [Bifidobacterium xylocopae]